MTLEWRKYPDAHLAEQETSASCDNLKIRDWLLLSASLIAGNLKLHPAAAVVLRSNDTFTLVQLVVSCAGCLGALARYNS